MAERRMFAKTIIDSDAFLDMPLSTQSLYFHLAMRADDDGFINNPKKIQRMIGATDDDFRVLISKRFIIPFESGIVVIKHWRIHNYIRSDRYKPTVYEDELSRLEIKENGAYTEITPLGIPNGNQTVYQMETQVRLGKDSIGKDRLDKVKDVCVEPTAVDSPPAITLTLNDKTEYPITQADIDEYSSLYPAVDILQELRKMKGWCDANPSKRKTKSGIRRFINSWLAREQDKGGTKGTGEKPQNNWGDNAFDFLEG